MHRLAQIVVAAESERQIAHAAANVRPGQVLLYPFRGADEVEGVAVVLLHSGGNGQHVGVEDDVARIYAGLFGEQPVRPAAHLNLAFVGGGLSLLVESHHHHCRPVFPYRASMVEKRLLALFQRNGVHHAFALHAFQRRLDNAEPRRVYHPRYARHLGVGSHEVEEFHHFLLRVEQSVVHIHVYQHRPVAHLFPGYGESLIILFLVDKSEELAASSHVAPLAHVHKHALHRLHGLQSGEPPCIGSPLWKPPCRLALHRRGYRADVVGRGTAAAAHDVHAAVGHEHADGFRHHLRRLVVLPLLIGEAGVGIGTYIIR